MIPFADTGISQDCAEKQIRMFAMFVGKGLFTTRAALEAASGISESTLRGWAGGAAMPVAALLHLRKFLPVAAINMLTEPGNVVLVDADATVTNWDDIAAEGSGLVAEICEARKDGNINHIEDARLRRRAREFASKTQHMIEGAG